MKTSFFFRAIAFTSCLSVAQGAIYHFVFTGNLDSQLPSSEDSPINLTAPISGSLTLDVTSTGDADTLTPENFPTTAAEFALLVGKNIRISASGSKVEGSFTSSGAPSPIAAVSFSPESIESNSGGGFPATLIVARPGSGASQEMALGGISLSFNPSLLGSLSLGDEVSGGLSGSFNFGEGSDAVKVDFTATSIRRSEPEDVVNPYIQREWRNLKNHVASLGVSEAIDDVTLPNVNFSLGGDDLDPIGVIPEASAMPALLGIFAALAVVRRKR